MPSTILPFGTARPCYVTWSPSTFSTDLTMLRCPSASSNRLITFRDLSFQLCPPLVEDIAPLCFEALMTSGG
ncbi:hypothetical protein NMG60_11017134 [Bertholletia excelsa]